MCVVVCMLDFRFIRLSINMCMCPHVHLYFCMCVHVHLCSYVCVYFVTLCMYMCLYPVELAYQKEKCARICHTCTLPLICAQQVTEVN